MTVFAKEFAKRLESEDYPVALILKTRFKLPRKITAPPARKVYNILKQSGYIKLAEDLKSEYFGEDNPIKRLIKKYLK